MRNESNDGAVVWQSIKYSCDWSRSTKHLDQARELLANRIGAKDQDIILTSGGTEADNLAIFGTAYARKTEGTHIITTQIEHHAVLHACEKLEKEGFEVTYLPVNEQGLCFSGRL